MTVGQCVCMCVLGVLVLGFISFRNREKKKLSVFEKLHVNIVGEKLTFVVRWVFICHSKWWQKQRYSWITVVMLTILKLIIPALLEKGLLMSAVFLLEVSCGQGKRNKGKEWYPTHPGSAVATLPHTLYPPPHLQEIVRYVALIVACVSHAIKLCCVCVANTKTSSALLFKRAARLPVEPLCPGLLGIASHPVCSQAWGFTVMPLC